MRRIVLATKNPGKLKELQQLLKQSSKPEAASIEFVLAPDGFDPEETGNSFIANATIKAQEAALQTKLPALADDSGLEVYALNREPGIRSARYCEGSDRDRRLKLLDALSQIPEGKRQGAFVCAIAVCDSDGRVRHQVECRWEGKIGFQECGDGGFGYDQIFIPEGLDKTSAEISAYEKSLLSHRGQAFNKIMALIL